MKKYIVLFVVSVASSLSLLADNYMATVWGIKGDGVSDNTTSIQRAVNAISLQGGGILSFPSGKYVTGPIQLKDNVTVHLLKGAEVIGVDNEFAYRQHKALFYGDSLVNCSVLGDGKLSGKYAVVSLTNTSPSSLPEQIDYVHQHLTDSVIYASAFGIKSNGTTLNTRAIQYAIDYISQLGGGTLCFQVGRYLTGTLYMRDNVTVELGSGAILVASSNPFDYDTVGNILPLIIAESVHNARIVGIGVIEGNGSEVGENLISLAAMGVVDDDLVNGKSKYNQVLFYAQNSQDISLETINMREPGWVSVYMQKCKNAKLSGLTIDAHADFFQPSVIENTANLIDENNFVNCIY